MGKMSLKSHFQVSQMQIYRNSAQLLRLHCLHGIQPDRSHFLELQMEFERSQVEAPIPDVTPAIRLLLGFTVFNFSLKSKHFY